MARLRYSALSGSLDAAIDSDDTVLSSPGFSAMPAVNSGNYLPIILDPTQSTGEPEIAYVTAHGTGSTSATVLRGQEQAHGAIAGRAHASGTTWHHGPTPGEFIGDVNSVVHDISPVPIPLTSPVVAIELAADIEAFTDGELNEVILVVVQSPGSGGLWTSNTGILVSWQSGSPPILSTTPGNYDVIRLIRVQAGVANYIGRVEIPDAALSFS